MASNTAIEWTRGADGRRGASWNPLYAVDVETEKRGWFCVPKSGGCLHCYASSINIRLGTGHKYTAGNLHHVEIKLDEDERKDTALGWPLYPRKPRNVFPCSMTDLFGEFVRTRFIMEIIAVMALAQWHTFMILTKRADRMREIITEHSAEIYEKFIELRRGEFGYRYDVQGMKWPGWPLPHVLHGVSVEDQQNADERRDDLKALAKAGAATWVSYEPALDVVDWMGWEFVRWLVSGGESGPGARPSHPDTHRGARDFCEANGIAYFFKQHGAWVHQADIPDNLPPQKLLNARIHDWQYSKSFRVGKKAAGRILDGREWNGMPTVGKKETEHAHG
jgi:protein gp37